MPKLQAFLTGALSQANRRFDERRAAEAQEQALKKQYERDDFVFKRGEKAFLKRLSAQEKSALRLEQEKRKLDTEENTWTHPILGIEHTGKAAEDARQLYLFEQEKILANRYSKKDTNNLVTIGRGRNQVNYTANTIYDSHTPQGALESLGNLNTALGVRLRPGQDLSPIVNHVRTLIGAATQLQLIDENDKDGGRVYFRPTLEMFPNLDRIARENPGLNIQELFEMSVPKEILTDPNLYESHIVDINGRKLQAFHPTGWRKAKPPDPQEKSVVHYIKYGGNQNPPPHIAPFFVNMRWNPSTQKYEYGMGAALLSLMFSSDPVKTENAAWTFNNMYEKIHLSNVPENQRNTGVYTIKLAEMLAEVAYRYIPHEIHNDQGNGKYTVLTNKYEGQELPPQVIESSHGATTLIRDIVADIDQLGGILQEEGQVGGLVHGTATFLDRYLDPEGGLKAVFEEVGSRIKKAFRNEFTQKTQRYHKDSAVSDVRDTELGLFLDGMTEQILKDENLKEVMENMNARGVKTKANQQEMVVIRRAQANLLKVKLGYQLAAMFQGGAGGRMISDQDLKIVMSALYAGANKQAQMAALNMLNVKLQKGYFREHVYARYGASGKAFEMVQRFEPIFDLRAKQALKDYNNLQEEAGGKIFITEQDFSSFALEVEDDAEFDPPVVPSSSSGEPNQMGE